MNYYIVTNFSISLVLMFVFCVCAIPLDTDILERDLRGDEDNILMYNNEDDTQNEVIRRSDEMSFFRDTRPARWNKNFLGVSSLDKSAAGFTKFMSPCTMGEVCKVAGKRHFRCKCNNFSYCVSYTPSSNAKCKYSAVGIVYKQ